MRLFKHPLSTNVHIGGVFGLIVLIAIAILFLVITVPLGILMHSVDAGFAAVGRHAILGLPDPFAIFGGKR